MNLNFLRFKFDTASSGVVPVIFVHWSNGLLLGEMVLDEAGIYYWMPNESRAFWDAYLLRKVAEGLDAINAATRKRMDEYFAKEQGR